MVTYQASPLYRRVRGSASFAFLCLVMSLVMVLPRAAGATTLYSNIVGNCCGGYSVAGGNGAESLGEAFIAPTQALLQNAQVEVFAVQGFGGDPYFNILLFSNTGGIPGSLIATLGTDLQAPALGGLVTASGATALLTAGTEYWIVLTPYDSSTQVSWEQGGSGTVPFDISSASTGVGGWSTPTTNNLQFAVNGTNVVTPEPCSLALLSSGTIYMLCSVRRRRRN